MAGRPGGLGNAGDAAAAGWICAPGFSPAHRDDIRLAEVVCGAGGTRPPLRVRARHDDFADCRHRPSLQEAVAFSITSLSALKKRAPGRRRHPFPRVGLLLSWGSCFAQCRRAAAPHGMAWLSRLLNKAAWRKRRGKAVFRLYARHVPFSAPPCCQVLSFVAATRGSGRGTMK